MDILSPASLWRDFDRKLLPLDVSIINSKIDGDFRVTALYFSALNTHDGFVRAYANFFQPLSNPSAPIIVYFNDINKSIEDRSTLRETMLGYSFLCVDYAGAADHKQRFTIFPKSLARLNFFDYPSLDSTIPKDIKKSSRYVWAVIAKRAITLAEQLPSILGFPAPPPTRRPLSSGGELCPSIGIIGVGLGGCPVIKACCIDADVVAGMTIYSAGFIPDEDSRPVEFTSFKAALDCESYSAYVSVPVLVEVASNERNGSLDYMNDVFVAMTLPSCRYSIVERTNRSISAKQRKNCKHWFDYHILGRGIIPASPSIRATNSDGRLYIESEVELDPTGADLAVELFVSQGEPNPAYRNWSGHKMERISEREYLAKVPVFDTKTPVYAFVNVKYDRGFSFSSPLLSINTERLSVRTEEAKPTRLIYDSDMGLDDWTVLNDSGTDEEIKLAMEAGPFEIEGVTSSTGSLSTFKLSEVAFRSFNDSALQVLIYSSATQDVTFSVSILEETDPNILKTDAKDRKDRDSLDNEDIILKRGERDRLIEYSCTRRLSPSDNWSNLTFSATDFKSSEGTLASFENVILFEIKTPQQKAIVSSLLWV